MLKQDLRVTYQAKRQALSDEDLKEISMKIGLRLVEWLSEHPTIEVIHTFLPAREKKEIDTELIIQHCISSKPDLKFAVPKLDKGLRRMTHHSWNPDTLLTPNRWGIPEPVSADEIDVNHIDLVLVPLLIFDTYGHRVGYGGGYYDAFLAECSDTTQKIGLCAFPPVPRITNVNSYDIKLDACITPTQVYTFQ